MSTQNEPATSGPASNSHRAWRDVDTRKDAHYDKDTHRLKNSVITLEHGPAGTIARITRGDHTDYAGPLSTATIQALKEVSQ